MNILFLTSHFNTGGITSYLLSLTRGLSQRGHKVFVASAGGDCESILKSYGGIHFNLGFRTKSEADLRIYLSLNSLKELVLKEKIDIIHAQTRVTQVMAYFLSRAVHKSFVSTCHGFFRVHFFRRIFPCWGDAVIAVSRSVREHLLNDFHVELNRIHLVANGIDVTQFPLVTEELREQKKKQWNIKATKVIGIIARLSDVKGIDVLIESMPMVIKAFPDILLMITGEGPQEQDLLTLVQKLNLEKYVRFDKIINQTAAVLPAFDLFVMPSRQEGLGLSVMEAQACALPVIASKVGGLVDLILDGRTGYFVPTGDPLALATKIIEVLKNPSQAQKIGLAARIYITDKFSLEQMVNSTERIYEQYSSR